MKRRILLTFFLWVSIRGMMPSQAFASDPVVKKTYCTQAINYASIDDLKRDLLINAKRLAVNEIFGELISASTAVENFVLTSDQIRVSSLGLIRIEGEVDYYNGENFAETCITIVSYTTEQDREKFEPMQRTKRHCVTDPDLTTREIKEAAREEAVFQALFDYDRKLEKLPEDEILHLMQRINYVDSGFIPETETYCTTVEGYVTPIEVIALLDFSESITNTETIVQSTETAVQPVKQVVDKDGHVGWAGSRDVQNTYYFDVSNYEAGLQYALVGKAFLGGCGSTRGNVSIVTPSKTDVIWTWTDKNVDCTKTRAPTRPNDAGSITPQTTQFVNNEILSLGSSPFTIDVTPFITENGNYAVIWDWQSGCCGIFIGGMELITEYDSEVASTATITSNPQFTVFAKDTWQDTGIKITSTDKVSIKYVSGEWTLAEGRVNTTHPWVQAEGYTPERPEWTAQGKQVPSAPYGALIGRIGTGNPFFVGRQGELPLGQEGNLWLRVNDSDRHLNDNAGQIVVEIILATPILTNTPTLTGTPTPLGLNGKTIREGIELELVDYSFRSQNQDERSAVEYSFKFTNTSNEPMEVTFDLFELTAYDNNGVKYGDWYEVMYLTDKTVFNRPDWKQPARRKFIVEAGGSVIETHHLTKWGQQKSRIDIATDWIEFVFPKIGYRISSYNEIEKETWRLVR